MDRYLPLLSHRSSTTCAPVSPAGPSRMTSHSWLMSLEVNHWPQWSRVVHVGMWLAHNHGLDVLETDILPVIRFQSLIVSRAIMIIVTITVGPMWVLNIPGLRIDQPRSKSQLWKAAYSLWVRLLEPCPEQVPLKILSKAISRVRTLHLSSPIPHIEMHYNDYPRGNSAKITKNVLTIAK